MTSQGRYLLSKDFSLENKKSDIMALMFQTTDEVYDSWIRETAFGFYEEQKAKTYTADDLVTE